MEYYATYSFVQRPDFPNSYILMDQKGEAKGIRFAKYVDSEKNQKLGIAGKEYIHFGIPRNASIRKYFTHTFEGFKGLPITSTDELNEHNQTFGDTRQLGYKDLILFQFSEDMKTLQMWFVKDKGNSKEQKLDCFNRWVCGEPLSNNEIHIS